MNWTKRYLAPCLLAVVAEGQLIAVHTGKLSCWEGGGFGMYSELPPQTRHVVVDFGGAQQTLTDEAEKQLREATEQFQAIPSERKLDAIAAVSASCRPGVPPGNAFVG
ncbi:MAG: hypothetical protein GY953_23830 [bacterium]|nr:hypothetical protein [bacterium]